MGNITDILKRLEGKIKLSVFFDKKEFVEICIEKTNIIIEVKNPVMALDYGLKAITEQDFGKDTSNDFFKMLKKKGYHIKLKYGVFEFDV